MNKIYQTICSICGHPNSSFDKNVRKNDKCGGCGKSLNKNIDKKEIIKTIKRHLKGIEKALTELEKE